MPTFDTPEPLSALIEFEIGTARISAGKRLDTVVSVLPSDGREDVDVKAAEQVQVTCNNGRLAVKGPKKRSLFGKGGSIEVSVELPAGSDVQGLSPAGVFTTEGRLGDCRFESAAGDIHVAEVGAAFLRSDHGDVRVDRATGDVEIDAAGRIDLGTVAGAANIRNRKGDTTLGEVTGELRVNSSNGRISVGVAHAGVDAKSDNGTIKLGEVARGQITLQTADGDLEVGIRESSAAWLEVNSQAGTVHNSIGSTDGPGPDAETVQVRARTGLGDIVIRRA
ncbi:DUF4097 family beta strand repeat-containing protein [Streptomyces flavofungini]|uniref:DUF4097 family beta strand repeat-containing protein n=1 Tax=Streptomyces flavofungini TaxID=68200 RepID=UPI0025AF5BD2|nr:DUF4097 family beta strand repeat-containing protein [Streptomyces flavofungini]WJV47857.1 DUF4097 family beta strand repeat-containing protein [Streptomyces flavofungini]